MPLALAAVWVAVVWLSGCASERLPAYAEHALRVTVVESSRDIAGKGSVRDGYRRTVAVLCAVLERDRAEGRGWVEWLVGAAGITGHEDLAPPRECDG